MDKGFFEEIFPQGGWKGGKKRTSFLRSFFQVPKMFDKRDHMGPIIWEPYCTILMYLGDVTRDISHLWKLNHMNDLKELLPRGVC